MSYGKWRPISHSQPNPQQTFPNNNIGFKFNNSFWNIKLENSKWCMFVEAHFFTKKHSYFLIRIHFEIWGLKRFITSTWPFGHLHKICLQTKEWLRHASGPFHASDLSVTCMADIRYFALDFFWRQKLDLKWIFDGKIVSQMYKQKWD